eukprot:TRINITY_DN8465_c0_g1_i1.p1 TRINITY_DN8465_c0_g1~~TRINITY_DN8465_c0_g1_i1.p1  ORF type:complete len:274 (-),score=83.56 TRINITY_DN8465_c0_g1_i1:399-1220(-)
MDSAADQLVGVGGLAMPPLTALAKHVATITLMLPIPPVHQHTQWVASVCVLTFSALVLLSDAMLARRMLYRSSSVAMAWVCAFSALVCLFNLSGVPLHSLQRTEMADEYYYIELSVLLPLVVYACGVLARSEFLSFLLSTSCAELAICALNFGSLHGGHAEKALYFCVAMACGTVSTLVLIYWALMCDGGKLLTAFVLLVLATVPLTWIMSEEGFGLISANHARLLITASRLLLAVGSSLMLVCTRGAVMQSRRIRRRSLRRSPGSPHKHKVE